MSKCGCYVGKVVAGRVKCARCGADLGTYGSLPEDRRAIRQANRKRRWSQ